MAFCNDVLQDIACFKPDSSSAETVVKQCRHILEGLFAYFFPKIDDQSQTYCKVDAICFLELTSIQTLQRSDGDPVNLCTEVLSWASVFQNCIGVSKMKLYLNRILNVGWNLSDQKAKPLNFYKSEVHQYMHSCTTVSYIFITAGEIMTLVLGFAFTRNN